ncbi:putative ribosomal RNA-processing protein Rrp9 [Septoria linicola]|nr:putative ribosomal RNA-processing protein Rrp9 [Septoria linicola]
MSSFFTVPASQRKRKRPQDSAPARKTNAPAAKAKARKVREESISGSDDEDEDEHATARNRALDIHTDSEESDDDDEDEDEDVTSKRIRLAEQYLANTQKEILDEAGFDAADVDKENLARRMGERLKEDTAETKGRIYRWIGHDLDWSRAERTQFRHHQKSVTGVAICEKDNVAYTVGNDCVLAKWQLPVASRGGGKSRKPTLVAVSHKFGKKKKERTSEQHTKAIRCVAASQDGKFVATGGLDKQLIIWDAATVKPLKAFYYQNSHRDSIDSLSFRRGTNQLFSASRDRTVKIWSLDELTYIETLFGHQDQVADVSALAQEKCVTVGGRDKTARLWKVVEESQLVFRGGGAPKQSKHKSQDNDSGIDVSEDYDPPHEGSMDRVACLDDETFVTGSDNGSLALWNVHKKKPVHVYPTAHGMDPPPPLTQLSAEEVPSEEARTKPQPRWITALRAIPFSDIFVSGSWDGYVRVWKLSNDKRRIEALGRLGCVESSVDDLLDEYGLSSAALSNSALQALSDGTEKHGVVSGVVNDLAIVDRGERAKDGVIVVAAVGKEHRLGSWKVMDEGKNYSVLFEIPRKVLNSEESSDSAEAGADDKQDDFGGFD